MSKKEGRKEGREEGKNEGRKEVRKGTIREKEEIHKGEKGRKKAEVKERR